MLKSISRTPTAIGKLEKLANADFYHNEKTICCLASSHSRKHQQGNIVSSVYSKFIIATLGDSTTCV